MHSHGRALNGLIFRAVDDVEEYDVREGELLSGVINGWNFGDGHFHDRQLVEAVQERCGFEPGDLRVVTLESQPAHAAPALPDLRRGDGAGRGGLRQRGRHGEREPWLDASARDFPVEVTAARRRRRVTARGMSTGDRRRGRARTGWRARSSWRGRAGGDGLEAADTIGGGTRTSELTVAGVLHDHCSAVHPMAVGSPSCARSGSTRTGWSGAGRTSTSPTRSAAAAPV